MIPQNGKKIIGSLIISILLLWQAGTANAIYSPTLSEEVENIRGHVSSAKSANGIGTFQNAWDQVNQENQELRSRGEAWGTPGDFVIFLNAVKELMIASGTNLFYEDWALLIGVHPDTGSIITNCLRDDIWEIKALQEEVLNELFKAALLSDSIHSAMLWTDYKFLDTIVNTGGAATVIRGGGYLDISVRSLKANYDDTDYWFPGVVQNYYLDCPFGEFKQVFEEVERSFNRLIDTFSGDTLSSWGSLAEQAQARAKQRAAEWIRKNQIGLTFGGEKGGNPQKLIDGPSLIGLGKEIGQSIAARRFPDNVTKYMAPQFVQSLKTNASFVGGFGEMIYDSALEIGKAVAVQARYVFGSEDIDPGTNVIEIVGAYNFAREQREKAEKQAETGLVYNLQLTEVSEKSLITIERKLFEINQEIRRAFTSDASSENVKILCEKLMTVAKKQCKNKSSDPPKCK